MFCRTLQFHRMETKEEFMWASDIGADLILEMSEFSVDPCLIFRESRKPISLAGSCKLRGLEMLLSITKRGILNRYCKLRETLANRDFLRTETIFFGIITYR